MRRLAAFIVACAVFSGCSKEPEKRKTCDEVKAAVRGIYRLENAVAGKGRRRPVITPVDVAGLSAGIFRKILGKFDPVNSRLWMPGEDSWLVVEHYGTNSVSLSAAMDAAAADGDFTLPLPDVFASYAGTLEEILPAFASALEGEVVPEWFVSRDLPPLKWLDTQGVEKDILEKVLLRIGQVQRARRILLEGNMLSSSAVDRKGERAAIEKWAEARQLNPLDPMLAERLGNLDRNARGFLSVGKFLQAMKCYETMILIDPDDAVSVHNFGMCLKKVGRLDMAEKVLEKAEQMRKESK